MLAQISFPHMGAREAEVWLVFIRSGHLPPGSVYYGARVGDPLPVAPEGAAWLRSVVNATSRKRIDACVHSKNAWWLYEVKLRAGLSCIGQALGYEYLFGLAMGTAEPIVSCVVCDRASRNIPEVCASTGVGLYVVHPDGGVVWTPPGVVALAEG